MTEVRIQALTKRYGHQTAVDGLTFDVPAGAVTAFLGPNGAGKTTTLRMLVGLARPSAGAALIDGRPFAELPNPRRAVGALLESGGFHPGRRGRDHLRILAGAARLPHARVDEVLDEVGLTEAGRRRVRGYSLGMRQRLGLAGALLGDPGLLVLDEPANGLDPAGMAWLRALLKRRAAAGHTVLVSSHVLAEVAQTADHVVIVHRGRLRYEGPAGGDLEHTFLTTTEATSAV
ncbi:ABC transporter ATP-binding protein [Dactylosporangium salmoneum]|uniref:ABC transporter domain-containing protein n=1 Tax=Dactylosporangium salmoneum TaxID=53361 RepID=A0ABP5SD80_9ACTN